jgi:MFS family permease
VYGTQTFAQYYIRDVLVAEDPIQLTGDLLAAIALALTAFSVAGGWLGDRFGHRRMSYIASLIGALGCFSLLWARTPGTLLVFGGILGLGIGLFLTANWALANQLAPADQAGKFLGLTNLATAGAAALGRLLGPIIDIFNNAVPGGWWGYTFLFFVGALCILISSVFLHKAFVR